MSFSNSQLIYRGDFYTYLDGLVKLKFDSNQNIILIDRYRD